MIKPDPKFFDDLARVAGGAMNVFSGLKEQIESDVRARVEEMASRMDLVPREDFDRLELQVAALQKRVDELTGTKKSATGAAAKPATKTEATKKATPKKTVTKKTAAKKSGKKKS
jgi:BMFP domain-containing protein YqiC